MDFEIYFSELDKKTQEALLNWAGLKDEKEANWDVLPIAVLPKSQIEEDRNA